MRVLYILIGLEPTLPGLQAYKPGVQPLHYKIYHLSDAEGTRTLGPLHEREKFLPTETTAPSNQLPHITTEYGLRPHE